MDDLPFQAEYAKTGRAACKGCKDKIPQGAVRLAAMVQSAFHDGKQANWYHMDCFFEKQRPKSISEIGKINNLRSEDRKKIVDALESVSLIVLPEKGKKGKGAKKRSQPNLALKDFLIQYSVSSRATCRHCEIVICKGEIRVSKKVFDTEVGMKFGGQATWYHLKCFNEERQTLLYMAGGEDLPGFSDLSADDQKLVKAEIKPLIGDEVPIKKLKQEPKDKDELKQEKAIEKKIEKQNQLYFKYYDMLSNLTRPEMKQILELNNQEVPGGKEECRSRVADMMAFGALQPCPECKQGQLVLESYGYKCTGNISEWAKCLYMTQDPARKKMRLPTKYKNDSAFKGLKVSARVFSQTVQAPVLIPIKSKENETQEVKKEKLKAPPLKNLQFIICVKSTKKKEEIKFRILKLGGLVVNKVQDTTAAAVGSKKDIEAMHSKMQDVQDHGIEVVEESFFDLIDKENGTVANTIQLIKENNIADWGTDPATRIPQDVLDGKSIPKSGSMYVKSKSGPTKLKLKGGIAVDPDSGLEDMAHVYKDQYGNKYTTVLGRTDIVAKKNSYYKLQLLEADHQKKYWVFRSWGRIGTAIGGHKLEEFFSLREAIAVFEGNFMEKTENMWEHRNNFVKSPDGYYPIEVDYGDDPRQVLEEDSSCQLPLPVQRLVLKIFDLNVMKQTLLEFELDTDKMPLGKLSKNQIKQGYAVLSELLGHLEKGGEATKAKIIDATNKFYTLVPHNFGMNNPPLLDNVATIKQKTEILDNLLEIEIAYSLMKTESNSDDKAISPIESHYLRLKTKIQPLDPGSPEHDMLQTYVKNTHAATHSQYTLEIEQIFKVVREGEEKRYKPFKKLNNRRLLWHGSRVTNFAGILSLGLRIAPPEAPATGYMFGKGIYFADMVSKSANYCNTHKRDPTGVMLLCEVALGEMKKCTRAEFVTKLPPGVNSVWGVGQTQPDPKMDVTLDDGTRVPLGTPVKSDVRTDLLYNEFIVYDVAQVNVKYLFQMKFNYKY